MVGVIILILTVAMCCLVVLTVLAVISLVKLNGFIDDMKKTLEKWEQEE